MATPAGKIYLVGIGYGNWGELTPRALETLTQVDIIAVEDTRKFGVLKRDNQLKLSSEIIVYNKDNENKISEKLVERVIAGATLALVSDAGVPLISDPGLPLVQAAIEADVQVVPVGFGSPALAALAVSGFPAEPHLFYGFLPRKQSELTKFAKQLEPALTYICYEAPNRLAKALATLAEVIPKQPACVVREISKPYEEVLRGTCLELAAEVTARPRKGALILVIGRAVKSDTQDIDFDDDEVIAQLRAGKTVKTIVEELVIQTGWAKSSIYKRVQSLKNQLD